jgi:hypothetical protein
MGGTNEQIAAALGISTGTLHNVRKRDPAIDEAITRGKDKADLQVVAALYKKALAGDTTAMIFWLKNRRPVEWRDRHETEIPGVERAIYEFSEKFLPALDKGSAKNPGRGHDRK